MKTRTSTIVSGMLGGALAVAMAFASAAEKQLTLGLNESLTGPGAVYGLPQANAVRMAAEEINAKGGIKAGGDTYKLNVIAYDDKANPTEGTNAVRKLIDRDSAQYIVGFCCSGPTSAVASFIGKEKVLMLVGNAAERSITTLGAPNLLRTRPPADFTGAAAGTFVASKGAKNIAVIGLKDRDMTPQLTKVRALNPDAILVLGYIEPAAFVYRQSVEMGMKVARYGFTSGSEEQFLRVATTEQMEGVWDLRPTELTLEALGATAKTYVANYTKKYGTPPSPSSPYAYDQVYVLKNAIEAAGSASDPLKVAAAAFKIGVPSEAVMKYLPVAGMMFDQNGQAYTSNGAFQWQKGKWIYVQDLPSDPAAYSTYLRGLRK